MEKIKPYPLPPLSPSTSIAAADRSKIYEIVRRHLADLLTGDQSYFPDGVQRSMQARGEDLRPFIDSVRSLKNQVNDPSDVLSKVIRDLDEFSGSFLKRSDAMSPQDRIELPPESSPTTQDSNVLFVDPDPGPFSPPSPMSPERRPKFRGTSLSSPRRRDLDQPPASSARALSRAVGTVRSVGDVPRSDRPELRVPPPIFFPFY